tara:strand:- start:2916 stop:3524 length:609 start_codon:yes stop_codon:yes gene_type:complete
MSIQLTHNREGPFEYAVVDNLFTPEELDALSGEIKYFIDNDLLLPPDITYASVDAAGAPLKSGRGLFLDPYFKEDRNKSAILNVVSKVFMPELITALQQHSVYFTHMKNTNRCTSLLNVYGNGDEYKAHYDGTPLSIISFVYGDEFAGGDLLFPEFNVKIKSERNRTVIFPGCVLHAVKPVIADAGKYRATVTQFLNYKEHA